MNRKMIGSGLAVAALALGLAVTPTAQAVHTTTAPTAEAVHTTTQTAQAITPAVNPEPTSTPAPAARIRVHTKSANQCSSGYLCLYVESNSNPSDGWWLFKFYNCGIVNLHYWHDQYSGVDSYAIDDQTGGVTTRMYSGYNGTGTVLTPPIVIRPGVFQNVLNGNNRGWNPVNSIKVC